MGNVILTGGKVPKIDIRVKLMLTRINSVNAARYFFFDFLFLPDCAKLKKIQILNLC